MLTEVYRLFLPAQTCALLLNNLTDLLITNNECRSFIIEKKTTDI